jgi:hypothetical protein
LRSDTGGISVRTLFHSCQSHSMQRRIIASPGKLLTGFGYPGNNRSG